MYFGYDQNGVIAQCAPTSDMISPGLQILEVDDTDPTAQSAKNKLGAYLVVNGALVAQPYLSLAVTGSPSSGFTITATLNNPPATPPSDVTFNILGTIFSETLSNNIATINVTIHESIASQFSVAVLASATGVLGAAVTIGNGMSQISLQAVSTSSGAAIGPSGSEAVAFLQQYYAVNSMTLEALLTNIATGMSLLSDAVFDVIIPALQAASYTPLSLSADQQNTLSDIKANLLPSLFTTLANGYPSGGSKQMQYGAFVSNFEKAAANVQEFMNALETFNL